MMPTKLEAESSCNFDRFGNCPKCGASWDAGNIFDALRPQAWCKEKTDAELQAYIEASFSPPYKFSRLIGVEFPHDHPRHYDGVSVWRCPDCNNEWNRFHENSRR
jgi:hypothetical protein